MSSLELVVSGLSGQLCSISAEPLWSVWDLKAAIEAETSIPASQQRLLLGVHELRDGTSEPIGAALSDLRGDDHRAAQLTLVRRPARQAAWLALVEKDWSQLLEPSAAGAWDDREVVAAAVERSGWALQHASEQLRSDRAIALAAVQRTGLALQFVSEELTADRDVALGATAQCGRALDFVAETLRADRAFMLDALRLNGLALEHAPAALRKDREAVLVAVGCSGTALASACPQLRADYEIVSAAVKQEPGALVFASAELRADLELRALAAAATAATAAGAVAIAATSLAVSGAALAAMAAVSAVDEESRSGFPDLPADSPSSGSGALAAVFFSRARTEGNLSLASRLGMEGAVLCELANLGLPVAPGFCCVTDSAPGASDAVDLSTGPLKEALAKLEEASQQMLGAVGAPLLLSVRPSASDEASTANDSFAGLTNIGLNDDIVANWVMSGNPRCALDCYRRFILSFARDVRGLDMRPFEAATAAVKARLDAKCQLGRKHDDSELPRRDLEELIDEFKNLFAEQAGDQFPQDPHVHLSEALSAALGHEASHARAPRRAIVQAMLLGNMCQNSAAGVAEVAPTSSTPSVVARLAGEWLPNAQHDDVAARSAAASAEAGLAATVTDTDAAPPTTPPLRLTTLESRAWAAGAGVSEDERCLRYPSLEERMPSVFSKLVHCQSALAAHLPQISEALRLEFVVQQGRLWIVRPRALQARSAEQAPREGVLPTSPEPPQDAEAHGAAAHGAAAPGEGEERAASSTLLSSVVGADDAPAALPIPPPAAEVPLPVPAACVDDARGGSFDDFQPVADLTEDVGVGLCRSVASSIGGGLLLSHGRPLLLAMDPSGSVVELAVPGGVFAAFASVAASVLDGPAPRPEQSKGAGAPRAAEGLLPPGLRLFDRLRRRRGLFGAPSWTLRLRQRMSLASGPRRRSAPLAASEAEAVVVVDDGVEQSKSWMLVMDGLEAPALRLPLWQTAFAGGLAGAATQLAAGNAVAGALRALPIGAICCTCYVNLLSAASGGQSLDSVSPPERLACAGLAASTALAATTLGGALRARAAGAGAVVAGLVSTMKVAVPTMAIEMAGIDIFKRMLVEHGGQEASSPSVLLLAGGAAGFVSQSILQPLQLLAHNSRPSPATSSPAVGLGGGGGGAAGFLRRAATAVPRGCRGPARPLATLVRSLAPAYRRSIPGAAANSLTRVGLVTQFMESSETKK